MFHFLTYQVVFIPHGANKQRVIFTHITTHSGRDIKMTKNHILPAGTCSLSPSPHSLSLPLPLSLPLLYASQVSVGDCIMTVSGQERVSAVENIRGEGVYTIVTNEVGSYASTTEISAFPTPLFSMNDVLSSYDVVSTFCSLLSFPVHFVSHVLFPVRFLSLLFFPLLSSSLFFPFLLSCSLPPPTPHFRNT
jgi:Hint module